MFDRTLKKSEKIQGNSEEENQIRTSEAEKENDQIIVNNIG